MVPRSTDNHKLRSEMCFRRNVVADENSYLFSRVPGERHRGVITHFRISFIRQFRKRVLLKLCFVLLAF